MPAKCWWENWSVNDGVLASGQSSDCPGSAPPGEPGGVYGGKRCRNCQSVLSPDEIALHRKLHNRAADSFLCIACNAQYFGVATQLLEEKIRQFKEMGCTLFQ